MQTNSPPPGRRILRLPAVISRTGMSRSWIYAAIAGGGDFPQPAKIGRMSVWDSDAIDSWIARQLSCAA